MQKHFYKLRFRADDFEWRIRAKRDLIFQFFEKYNRKNGKKIKLLDFGCGTGVLQLEFEKKFSSLECFGLDKSKEAIKLCHLRGITRVKLSKGGKIPFPDNFFDVVTAIDVLEHIKNDSNSLFEIKRVLKKGGLAFFLVPSHQTLWSTRDLRLKHFRRYQKGELYQKCQMVGFSVVVDKNVDFILYFIFLLMHKLAKKYKGVVDLGWETAQTNKLFNKVFFIYEMLENRILKFFSFPIGLSNLVIVKRR